MVIQSYRDLIAWQKVMDLVESVYRATMTFPREEDLFAHRPKYDVLPFPSHPDIAEGQGRNTTRDFHPSSFPSAQGSVKEVETQLLIAERLECTLAKQITATLA